MSIVKWGLPLLAGLSLFGAPAHAAAPPGPRTPAKATPLYLRLLPAPVRRIEAVQMVGSILFADGPSAPGTAWFHPSQSAYGWDWLSKHVGVARDGALTRKDFKGPPEWFDRLDRDGKGRLTAADFDWSRRLPSWMMPPKGRPKPPPPKGKASSGMPSRWVLLRGVLSGELGSLWEGPSLGQMAPDFKLSTHDGERTVALRDYRGKKPVVLIFGSFT
jgi:hypothetical protein